MSMEFTDKSLRYGWRYGGKMGISVAATSADYFNRRGSAFCRIESGVARMCSSTDTVLDGWLQGPKETTQGAAVVLTGGKYHVITDPTAVFECPADESAASLARKEGESCYVMESGSTTTWNQKVKLATGDCATNLLLIWDVDTTNHTAFVSINPSKYDFN